MDTNESSDYIMCPYDQQHVIPKLKIQKHIIKCQKSHPHSKLVACVYNFTHRVRPEKLLEHYETCPQKWVLDGNTIKTVKKRDNSQFSFPSTSLKNEEDFFAVCQFSNKNFMEAVEMQNQLKPTKPGPALDEKNENDSCTKPSSHVIKPLSLPETVSKAFTKIDPAGKKPTQSELTSSEKNKFQKPMSLASDTLPQCKLEMPRKRSSSSAESITDSTRASSDTSSYNDEATSLVSYTSSDSTDEENYRPPTVYSTTSEKKIEVEDDFMEYVKQNPVEIDLSDLCVN